VVGQQLQGQNVDHGLQGVVHAGHCRSKGVGARGGQEVSAALCVCLMQEGWCAAELSMHS
jgi:hypothetical protein